MFAPLVLLFSLLPLTNQVLDLCQLCDGCFELESNILSCNGRWLGRQMIRLETLPRHIQYVDLRATGILCKQLPEHTDLEVLHNCLEVEVSDGQKEQETVHDTPASTPDSTTEKPPTTASSTFILDFFTTVIVPILAKRLDKHMGLEHTNTTLSVMQEIRDLLEKVHNFWPSNGMPTVHPHIISTSKELAKDILVFLGAPIAFLLSIVTLYMNCLRWNADKKCAKDRCPPITMPRRLRRSAERMPTTTQTNQLRSADLFEVNIICLFN